MNRLPGSIRSRSADIRDLVKDLKQRQIGVLITDHNVRETLDIVDRACIIYDGRVLFAGSPEALVADENVRRLYLGEGFCAVARIWHWVLASIFGRANRW